MLLLLFCLLNIKIYCFCIWLFNKQKMVFPPSQKVKSFPSLYVDMKMVLNMFTVIAAFYMDCFQNSMPSSTVSQLSHGWLGLFTSVPPCCQVLPAICCGSDLSSHHRSKAPQCVLVATVIPSEGPEQMLSKRRAWNVVGFQRIHRGSHTQTPGHMQWSHLPISLSHSNSCFRGHLECTLWLLVYVL